MAVQELTDAVVAERIAILKRFRELLEEQRSKFRQYLGVLERQETVIGSGDVEAIVQHTEIEQAIVSEIQTIQKVMDPLEDMYRSAYPDAQADDIPELKTDLDRLRGEVLSQNEKNREL
jgi:hypothetical protein